LLRINDSLLLVIDVQEKLFPVMWDKDILLPNLLKMVRGCRVLDVPVIFAEQNPKGLGPTVPELGALFSEAEKVIKFNFSCCTESEFCEKLKSTGRQQILICGIESHICVYQTAMDLIQKGYEVQVVNDCISSRSAQNKELSLRRLESENVKLTGVEMALFELLRTSKSQHFKAISSLIRE
jgi:nicotinamidase-related amidase